MAAECHPFYKSNINHSSSLREEAQQIPGSQDIRGRKTEEKVAGILRDLPDISSIYITEKNGLEDQNMIDLVVFFKSCSDNQPDKVNIQVKSSSREVRSFRNKKMKGLLGIEARQQWLIDRNLILLAGDIIVTRDRKKYPLSNEEIIADFSNQLQKIRLGKRLDKDS